MRSETGWVFPPLHVGVVVAPGWLLHVERATAAVLARYHDGPVDPPPRPRRSGGTGLAMDTRTECVS